MLLLSDPFVIPEWTDELPVLMVDDIHGLSDSLIRETEGTRRPSWIWTMNTGNQASGAENAGDEGAY